MKNLLKLKRWEAGMKQYELANRLGCSASLLSMIENGRAEPTVELKEKAAAVLNLDADVLFPKKVSDHKGMLAHSYESEPH